MTDTITLGGDVGAPSTLRKIMAQIERIEDRRAPVEACYTHKALRLVSAHPEHAEALTELHGALMQMMRKAHPAQLYVGLNHFNDEGVVTCDFAAGHAHLMHEGEAHKLPIDQLHRWWLQVGHLPR